MIPQRTYQGLVTPRWDSKPVEYEHFTDLGHYMLELKGASAKDVEYAIAEYQNGNHDIYRGNSCSGTIKKNNAGEVLMSHSMDVEISSNPAFLSLITDGKYNTLCLTYLGGNVPYRYDAEGLAALDKDTAYLKSCPFMATDVFNEKGLYMSIDMRCGDTAGGMDCPGTNPGKPRLSCLSSASMVGLNCATVREAVEYLNNSYDWFTYFYVDITGERLTWNMAFLIGDATGEYGLIEFGRNAVYFTPYQNFQSNYYIHPMLAERAVDNHGHGRASVLLPGLMDVQTEQELMENQKKSRYRVQLLNPSEEYFSDAEDLKNVNVRRNMSNEMMFKVFDQNFLHTGGIDDHREKLLKYYAGDEAPLRNDSMIWMGTITSGVNCAKKRATIQMWENDTFFDVQW